MGHRRRRAASRPQQPAARQRPTLGHAAERRTPLLTHRLLAPFRSNHNGQHTTAQAGPKKKANPLRAGQHIDYKDTATLRKFISERGKIRARRVTGLSVQEQRKVAIAIKNAREVALLPYASTAR